MSTPIRSRLAVADDEFRDNAAAMVVLVDEVRALHDDVLAGAAGIFGPTYDQHPELRRHDVELLADVLANPVKLGGTLGRRRTRN